MTNLTIISKDPAKEMHDSEFFTDVSFIYYEDGIHVFDEKGKKIFNLPKAQVVNLIGS